ncbi:GatB/YqeY domain-containing protein [Chloroflexota bacterium]
MAKEAAELAILTEYLPEQIGREDIVAAARRVIEETGAQGPRDKGKVMAPLIAELRGRAEGREINEVVNELLGSAER